MPVCGVDLQAAQEREGCRIDVGTHSGKEGCSAGLGTHLQKGDEVLLHQVVAAGAPKQVEEPGSGVMAGVQDPGGQGPSFLACAHRPLPGRAETLCREGCNQAAQGQE